MLAKVSGNYYGTFGLFHEETGCSEIKTREGEPFEVGEALFYRMEKYGVLMKADNAGEARAETDVSGAGQPAPAPLPDSEEDAGADLGESLEDLSMKELREVALGYGVAYRVGMTKKDLIKAIEEADITEPPIMTAAEPE